MLKKVWKLYQKSLAEHPVKTQIISSGVIWAVGDVSAQSVTHYTNHRPLSLSSSSSSTPSGQVAQPRAPAPAQLVCLVDNRNSSAAKRARTDVYLKTIRMVKNVAQSPLERSSLTSVDQKLALAKRCSHEGAVAGAKAAVVATIATAIPTLASARILPWARANLNHSAQALIISTVAGAAYFIVADKTVLASARRNSFNFEQGQSSGLNAEK